MSDLKERIERLREMISGGRESDTTYMSKMRHWLCVHATKYEPKCNEEGDLFIPTTAMATDDELPRSSVHVTLNQVVASHMGGNWDACPIVILAPYNDVVDLNGNPQEVATADTYFIPNPDKGLVLPKSTYIVKPSLDNSKLYEIGENCATYKTDNYTDEEIEEILSLSGMDKYRYDELMSGKVSDYEAKMILGYDEKLMDLYDKTEDKQAFMRGVLEEDRFVILNKLLRDATVKMAMGKMDFRYVLAHEDEASGVVAETAIEEGIRGNSGNKGHSCSLEAELEEQGCILYSVAQKMKTENIDDIYNALTSSGSVGKSIISCILKDKSFEDGYNIYQDTFDGYAKRKAEYIDDAEGFQRRGIKGYNEYLDITLHRHADKMTKNINQSINELKENPEQYTELKNRLQTREMMQTKAYDDRFNGMGW